MSEPGEPDYTLQVEEPPDPAAQGGGFTRDSSPLINNLLTAKEEFPNEWVRIASYAGKRSAITVASNLRTRQRPKNIPSGNWEFRSGPLPTAEEGFGVWAIFLGEPDEVDP